MNRREFLQSTAALTVFAALPRGSSAGDIRLSKDGYGTLTPAPDRVRNETLLELPKDFWYVALTADGDKMRDGFANPAGPRQLGCFRSNGQIYVARNHVGDGTSTIGPEANSHRPSTPGGLVCVILESGTNELVRDWCLLSGIEAPVAGTATPWGTWLAVDSEGNIFEARLHQRDLPKPIPLRPFGDARVGPIAYDFGSNCLFAVDPKGPRILRWAPKSISDLGAGGAVHELSALDWQPRGGTGTWTSGATSVVTGGPKVQAVVSQSNGLLLLTAGAKASATDVWLLEAPQRMVSAVKRLQTLDIEASSIAHACATPAGGIVVATKNRIVGFEVGQKPFDLVRTVSPKQEVRGLSFTLDGGTLIASLDEPGILVALSGPWESGPL